jgi:hypothetical protein
MEIFPNVVSLYDGANADRPTVTMYELNPYLWFVHVEDGRNHHTELKFFDDKKEARKYYRGWVDG